MKKIPMLYQNILEKLVDLDTREFQVSTQQRLVTAMNYLYQDDTEDAPVVEPDMLPEE